MKNITLHIMILMEGIDLASLIQIFKGFKSTLPRPAGFANFCGRGGARPAFLRGGAALFRGAGRTSLIYRNLIISSWGFSFQLIYFWIYKTVSLYIKKLVISWHLKIMLMFHWENISNKYCYKRINSTHCFLKAPLSELSKLINARRSLPQLIYAWPCNWLVIPWPQLGYSSKSILGHPVL